MPDLSRQVVFLSDELSSKLNYLSDIVSCESIATEYQTDLYLQKRLNWLLHVRKVMARFKKPPDDD